MNLKIITIGEPKNDYKELFLEYLKRASRFSKVTAVHIKDGKKEDEKVIDAIGKSFCVLLDERGKEFTSKELANFIEKKELQSIGEMSFVIGGPDGHGDAVRERADFIWSFSKLTFPHDLAHVILIEALYRALSITAGHPYHRE